MIEARNKPPRRDERRRARDQKRHPGKAEMRKAHHRGKMAGFKMNSQEQSTEANSKAKPMIARVVVCHNGRKPTGPVLENTYCKAYAAHDETVGFVAPKFHSPLNFEPVDQCPNSDIGMVFWRGGGYPQGCPHGFAHVFNHHAHPQCVKTLRVVPKVRKGTKTMQLATTALRPSAQTAHHGHITTPHTGDFNRDVLAVGNAENAIARVLFELRKPQPDTARALKLAQSAMLAIGLVGEVLQ